MRTEFFTSRRCSLPLVVLVVASPTGALLVPPRGARSSMPGLSYSMPPWRCCLRRVSSSFDGQAYSQLSSLRSSGWGEPLPVSRSDFRLSRKTAHLVLQWCMNSTGSFHP